MVSVKHSLEKAREIIKKKQPHLELVEYNGYYNNAVFIDCEYGKFTGLFQTVSVGGKHHPNRTKEKLRKINFEKAKEKIENKFSYLKLIEFTKTSGKAIFYDFEFGEFTGFYSHVYSGRKKHSQRIKKEKFEKNKKKLKKKYSYLDLCEYTANNKKAVFIDEKYGKFTAIFQFVFKGSKKHPERLRDEIKARYCEPIKYKFNYLTLIDFNQKTKIAKFLDEEYGEFFGNYYKVLDGAKRHPKRAAQNKFNASQKESVKEKRKKTCLDKYGVETPLLNDKIKQKINAINLERFGTTAPMKTDLIKDRVNETKIKNGVCHSINGISIKEKYDKSGVTCSYTKFINIYKSAGIEAALRANSKKTDIELIIEGILKDLDEQFIFDKQLDSTKYRPDFLLKNIIIEADGIHHHSDLFIKDKFYHKNKRDAYINNNYMPLFFRGDEIIRKTAIVRSIIKAKLQKIDNKYYARKCLIKKYLKTSFCKDWFDTNHLMGSGSGTTYCLFCDNEIVAAMSVINKKKYLEISRFSNKIDSVVVGGFSKLLKAVICDFNPKTIISFVDLRYGSGFSLEKNGFIEKSSHVSFKWTDFNQTYHRMRFPGNSGYKHGLYKIWDCGQKKFVLEL